MIRTLDHDAGRGTGRECLGAGDQRPHPVLPSLPDHGRRDDLRGARGPIAGRTVAWLGDGNNVLDLVGPGCRQARLRHQCRLRRRSLRRATALLEWAAANGARRRRSPAIPRPLPRGADCVVTDTWVSMGDDEARTPPEPPPALSGQPAPDGDGQARCDLHALPAGPSRRRGHGRGHRRTAVGGLRRGREPPPRPEGHPCLGLRHGTAQA